MTFLLLGVSVSTSTRAVHLPMADAYANGAVLSGNSAGAAVESTNMIAGYTGSKGPENGFERDSVLLWPNDAPNDSERGLSFGLPGVLLDQHVAQCGRIASS